MTPEEIFATIRAAAPDPAGPVFVVQGDMFAIDRSVKPEDAQAASDPVRQKMQVRIAAMAQELADSVAGRFGNRKTWARLPATAAAFASLMREDPRDMPGLLGDAYPLLLRLGRFLETDTRLAADRAAMDDPLEPDDAGLLADVVRPAAAWLRGFPTVRVWDDEAGKALLRPMMLEPAISFARKAREVGAVSERDAAEVEAAEDAESRDFVGEKTHKRAYGWMRNLLLAGASLVGASLFDAGVEKTADHFGLFEKVGKLITEAPAEIEALAETVPSDLALSLRALVAAAERGDWSALLVEKQSDPPVPEDVEEQAREMILRGEAPPRSWRPDIRNLKFRDSALANLSPLAGLTALQSLSLQNTQVSDLAPLAHLTALQLLNLRNTQVSDLDPLADLTALRTLDLSSTQVSDVAPLAHLTALQSLHLRNTQVSDMSSLADLTALRTLDLSSTQVSNLGPLADLTALQTLDLFGTQVTDVAPLAKLTALQTLYLGSTQVHDLAPLASLSALEELHLQNTQISDLAQLAHITNLKALRLLNMPISDVVPLAQLSNLQSLDLRGTQVSDVAPLASLTALRTLDLRDTQVSDVTPLAGLPKLARLMLRLADPSDVEPLHGSTEGAEDADLPKPPRAPIKTSRPTRGEA